MQWAAGMNDTVSPCVCGIRFIRFLPIFASGGQGGYGRAGKNELQPPAKRQQPACHLEPRGFEQVQRSLVARQDMRFNQFDGFLFKATADFQQQGLSVPVATL